METFRVKGGGGSRRANRITVELVPNRMSSSRDPIRVLVDLEGNQQSLVLTQTLRDMGVIFNQSMDSAAGMRAALLAQLCKDCPTPDDWEAVSGHFADMPQEAIMYWFTLCFYGYRQLAARKALYTLLVTVDDQDAEKRLDNMSE